MSKAFSHDRVNTGKEEWLTPPEIIKVLGEFDLDPCAPITRPWDMAKNHYTINDHGLLQKWEGRIWLNPPYGNKTHDWLLKLANHGNGIALTFARTETLMFFDCVWDKADAVFFFKGRLKFYHRDGSEGDTAGAPSILIAYGFDNVVSLKNSGLNGKFILLNEEYKVKLKENEIKDNIVEEVSLFN